MTRRIYKEPKSNDLESFRPLISDIMLQMQGEKQIEKKEDVCHAEEYYHVGGGEEK